MQVINASTLDGRLFRFRLKDGRFQEVSMTADHEPAAHGSVQLKDLSLLKGGPEGAVLDMEGALVLPAGLDVHVHSRDPGLTHKESWTTLAQGAYKGGVVAVADMPNTVPPTMWRNDILQKAEIAAASGLSFGIFLGVGAANINEVGGLLKDPSLPLCGLKVYYGQSTGELMYDDLETLRRSLPDDGSKVIVFHSEDQCMVDHNHDRYKDRLHTRDKKAFRLHSEIRSSATAHASTKTILQWAKGYGRPVHIAHLSTPMEVEMIAEARSGGVRVTSEVAPHHLLFSTDDYDRLGPLIKMNPPVRSPQEVEALGRLVAQGAVEVFATDHAPHTLEEKTAELARCPSGVPSIEFFYPLLFEAARRYGIPEATAVNMASGNPAEIFGFKGMGRIEDGYQGDFVVIRRDGLDIRQEEVVSKCRWTPYDGWRLPCQVVATWHKGRLVFKKES